MGEDFYFSLRVPFRGKFNLQDDNKLRYTKKVVRWLKDLISDEVSKVVIEFELKQKFGIEYIREHWYLILGEAIDKGLKKIEDDMDIIAILSCVNSSMNTLQLYVLSNDEDGPTDLRERQIVVDSVPEKAIVTWKLRTNNDQLDIFDQEDGDIPMAETSSDGTNFKHSQDEGEHKDNDLSDPYENLGSRSFTARNETVLKDFKEMIKK